MKKTLSSFGFAAACVFLPALCTAQTTTLDPQQTAFVTLINNYRGQNGVGPLQVSVTLQQAAQWMSNDMATKNYFSHTDSLGRDPFTRMADFAYAYYPEGENLAAGYSDAQDTFTQWQTACDPDSTGTCTYAHRQNMLNASYKALGIGQAYSATSTYGWYWTADFGAYVDQPLNPPSTAPVPTIGSFTATPAAISAGQLVTLAWSVSGATTININNGPGNVSSLSSFTIAPTATTTYALTATNASGTSTASATVTVNASATPAAISIWPSTSYPTMYLTAGGPIELGVKIRSDVAGEITGVRFYKISANTGVHTGSLWTSNGLLLATGAFTGETASGWQTLTFASPVTILPNTMYVASYHTNAGVAAVGFDLENSGVNNPPLHALQTGVDGYDGIYMFSAGGLFPSEGTSGYNFWVDIVFVP